MPSAPVLSRTTRLFYCASTNVCFSWMTPSVHRLAYTRVTEFFSSK